MSEAKPRPAASPYCEHGFKLPPHRPVPRLALDPEPGPLAVLASLLRVAWAMW